MNTEFKTTFIPKKKLSQSKGESTYHGKSNNLLSLVASLLFLTAVIAVAGMYMYRYGVEKSFQSKVNSIKIAEKSFEPSLILSLKKLDIRLKSADELLKQHIALSDFFEKFGATTLPDVSFTDFSFNQKDGENEVSMNGTANDYITIAQQSDSFEKNQYIKNPIFSDFQLTDDGKVSFALSFTLDKDFIRYGRKVRNNNSDEISVDNLIIKNEKNDTLQGKDVDPTTTVQ